MATKVASQQRGWLTLQQSADYLGVSIRGLKYAVSLKKQDKANHSLILKTYGNRTLINKVSLDEIETIIIRSPHN